MWNGSARKWDYCMVCSEWLVEWWYTSEECFVAMPSVIFFICAVCLRNHLCIDLYTFVSWWAILGYRIVRDIHNLYVCTLRKMVRMFRWICKCLFIIISYTLSLLSPALVDCYDELYKEVFKMAVSNFIFNVWISTWLTIIFALIQECLFPSSPVWPIGLFFVFMMIIFGRYVKW